MDGAGTGRRILSALVCCALCGASFFGTAAAIRPLVPLPNEWGLAEKSDYFAAHKDEYDVVFVGSSHVWRSVIPEIFDHELALRGHEVKSFNFGVGGMRTWECDFTVRRILELKPAKLRWLVLEGGDWDADFPSGEIYNSRTVYWHDRRETFEVIKAVWKQEQRLADRLRLTFQHLQLWLWRASNFGQGWPIAAALRGVPLGTDQGEGSYTLGEGFQTQDLLTHPEFARNVEDYLAGVAKIEAANETEIDLDALYLGAMERREAAAAARGVEIIALVPPLVGGAPVEWRLHAAGKLDTLFNFNRPERFPELFRPETRFSPDHMNLIGAREFTHLLARAFARHLKGEEVE